MIPHYHPRADEWEFTYAGTPTGFLVPESYIGDPLNFTLSPGMQAVYPQATLHSQANFGCETVKISVGFHSSDAGFVIPNFWATNFPGFDTTLPPEAAQKIDEAHAALVVSISLRGSCSRCFCRRRRSSTDHTRCRCPAVQDALKANPEAESMLYQVYFRYAGFRPMPKSACSCPGRPSIDDYAATLDPELLKAGFDDAMTAVMGGKSSSAAAAASPSPSGPSSPPASSGANRAGFLWTAALALVAHTLFGGGPGGLKHPLLALLVLIALSSPAFGQQVIPPPAGMPTEAALAQGAYPVYANLTTPSAAVSDNLLGTLYNAANTALANATSAADVSALILQIEPCSYLVPHYHPRGDEWEFTYAGTTTGFLVPESFIGPALKYTLTPGQQAVYPQATLHSQANFGCETTKISVYFPTSNPGDDDAMAMML